MLLFSVLNSSYFGTLSDSAIHRFSQTEIAKTQSQILNLLIDHKENPFSIQNITKMAKKLYGCEVGNFYSPIVIMDCIKEIFEKTPKKK